MTSTANPTSPLPAPPPTPAPPTASRRRVLVLGLGALAVVTGVPVAATRWSPLAADTAAAETKSAAAAFDQGGGSGALFSSDRLHEITLDIDDASFADAVAAYESGGDKVWLEISATLDGTTYERCGIRLKGNSTLRRLDDAAGPAEYPWLVRLDQVVDGQDHQGVSEFAVRANNSASSLNEAVALDLLATAGLASQDHGYAVVRVGAASALRLVVEHPGDTWVERELASSGILYKAEATGDYTYRGTDPAAYDDVFDQESGDTDDLGPLVDFLEFVNDSNDADFVSGLPGRLDVEAFATYLALEDLMENYDAIDGPGNNSYLWWDEAAKKMTVLGWDHNLTFGVSNRPGAGQGAGGAAGGAPPAGGGAGGAPPGGGGGGRGPGPRAANPLVTRFEAVDQFASLVAAATTRLRADLYAGGVAAASLRTWSTLLEREAGDLLDAATLMQEKAAIAAYLV